MGRVFVSHSSEDENGKTFLQKLFGSVQHEAFFYSWDGPRPPHIDTLRERIEESDSLFVLLSPHIADDFTLAWVACEVGIALGLSKPVWVLEHQIGPGCPAVVKIPMPGVTGYIERPGSLKNLRTEPYFGLAARAGVGVPNGPDGLPLRSMGCPHDSCRANFYYYFEGKVLVCPVCRKNISIG